MHEPNIDKPNSNSHDAYVAGTDADLYCPVCKQPIVDADGLDLGSLLAAARRHNRECAGHA